MSPPVHNHPPRGDGGSPPQLITAGSHHHHHEDTSQAMMISPPNPHNKRLEELGNVNLTSIGNDLRASHYKTLQAQCSRGGTWVPHLNRHGKLLDMTGADWRRLFSAGTGCRDRMAGRIVAAFAHRLPKAVEDAEAAAMWSVYHALLDHSLSAAIEVAIPSVIEVARSFLSKVVMENQGAKFQLGALLGADGGTLDERVRRVEAIQPAQIDDFRRQCPEALLIELNAVIDACVQKCLRKLRIFVGRKRRWYIPAAKDMGEEGFLAVVLWRVLLIGIFQRRDFGGSLASAVHEMRMAGLLLVWHVGGTSDMQRTERGILTDAYLRFPDVCATEVECRCAIRGIRGCTSNDSPLHRDHRASAHMMSICGLFLTMTCRKSNSNPVKMGVATLRRPRTIVHYFGPNVQRMHRGGAVAVDDEVRQQQQDRSATMMKIHYKTLQKHCTSGGTHHGPLVTLTAAYTTFTAAEWRACHASGPGCVAAMTANICAMMDRHAPSATTSSSSSSS